MPPFRLFSIKWSTSGEHMFIINGQFTAKANCRAALTRMAADLVKVSNTEAGCISYQFLEDQTTPGNFLFFEKWKSREAINEHFGKPYFQEFAKRFPEMIEGEATIEIHEIKNTESV